jgi:hypothetical protein
MSVHLDHLVAKERAEAVAGERERCARLVEKFEIEKSKRRHPRTNAMFQRIADAIRKG